MSMNSNNNQRNMPLQMNNLQQTDHQQRQAVAQNSESRELYATPKYDEEQ